VVEHVISPAVEWWIEVNAIDALLRHHSEYIVAIAMNYLDIGKRLGGHMVLVYGREPFRSIFREIDCSKKGKT
jgi:hypothetical protein